MTVVEQLKVAGHEQVLAFRDDATGLRGFIAIHDTTHGPALGGTRVWPYASEEDALADALRLSRAMTYKAALAELPCGGGKAVLIEHPGMKRAAAFEAFGRLVESLAGRFFTGPDVGITEDDLAAMARGTRHVAAQPSLQHDDISEHTAIGVWHGLRACLDFAGLRPPVTVAIQGVGSVGMALARLLRDKGMNLIVSDTDAARMARACEDLPAQAADPSEVLLAAVKVVAPCALGGVIDTALAGSLRARVVCGSANNILVSPEAGDVLAQREILYAPDYLVNAGGLIRGAELHLLRKSDSRPSLERIYYRTLRVLQRARERGVATGLIADELAEARLAQARTHTLPPAPHP